MKDYKELDVWQKSMSLVLACYEVIRMFPKDERYALADQMKRAAISIPSNIAEGASRNTTKDFIHFLYIASSSTAELETQMIIAEKLGYIGSKQVLYSEITTIRKMLNALIKTLKTKCA